RRPERLATLVWTPESKRSFDTMEPPRSLMLSRPATPLKVFYAYSRVDTRFRTELSKHLVDLRNRRLIEDFFDGDIGLGEDWDRRIRKELDEADLILPLISTDFMTSA